MAYIDYTYYTDTYKGTPIDQTEFDTLSERASDIIDILTSYKLYDVVITDLHALIQSNLKKATAAQTEYLAIRGGEVATHGSESVQSVNIGNFSYQEGSATGNLSREKQAVSPFAISFLSVTGLLHRGVDVSEC